MLRRARLWDCMSSDPPLVCVTFRYRDNNGWNTSKIISRPNSLRHLLSQWPQHGRSGATGTPPKLGWIGLGSGAHKSCEISETVQDRAKVTIWTNRKSRTRFRLVSTSIWPWMTLNGWNVPLAEIKSSYGAHQKNFNEDWSISLVAKCRSMILVSKI